jgi:hypothetical protein
LGPAGTDASAVAYNLSDKVCYLESFEAAMNAAVTGAGYALVACGYKSSLDGSKSWCDLHFSFLDALEIVDVLHAPTKPMCIALNDASGVHRSIAIHPATEIFLRGTPFQPRFFSNKVAAVRAAASGRCDACIGSCDVVSEYPQLQIVKTINASMVWVLYRKRTI